MNLPFLSAFHPSPRWTTAAKLAALFLLMVGGKLCVIRADSTPLPFFDQWQAEGVNLIQRSLHGTLGWADLFAPHNQHRILWTRLLVLGLFRVNGQWDTQVEMIAAAGLHALCAVALGAILIRRLGRAAEDQVLCCLAFLFVLPFGWEDTLSGGFQSQYYFLILFSVVTLWGLASHRPWTAPWWLGLAAGVLAWFSVASGWFAGVVVAVWTAFRWWRGEGRAREHAITLAAAVLLSVGGVGLLLGTRAAEGNYQAKTAGEFLWKFCGLLSWPGQTPWLAAIAYAPLGGLLWRRWRGGQRLPHRTDSFALPLAGWVLLQTAALAYGRNHYRGLDVSRYMDVQSLGALANFVCLLVLARELGTADASDRARAGLRALQVLWVVCAGFGLHHLTDRNLRGELPFTARNNATEERNVLAFLAAPDPRRLADKTWSDFQCESLQTVADVLTDPAMRAVLPTPVRPPLPLLPGHFAGGVRRINAGEAASIGAEGGGWLLASPAPGQAPSVFRSQTMQTNLPVLEFSVAGRVGAGAQVGLIGERSGRVTPLLPDDETGALWTATILAPAEPFHLVAKVEPGSPRGLVFFEPREVGRLSIWVDPLLRSATGWLFAGVLLWLGSSACSRWKPSESSDLDDGVEKPSLSARMLVEPAAVSSAASEPPEVVCV